MNKVKIKIKADGVNLKTDDVGLALQVLERLDQSKAASSFLHNLFGGVRPDEETDDDFEIRVTKVELNPDGTIPEKKETKQVAKKKTKRTGPMKLHTTESGRSLYHNDIYKEWTGEEKNLIRELIRAGLTNKEIGENKLLLQRHTNSAILTKASNIRNVK